MTTSPTVEATTVEMPAVSMPIFRQLVDRLAAQHPASASRVEAAAAIVFKGTIREGAVVGEYLVPSCQTPDRFYTTSTFSCDCPDASRNPTLLCKHRAAVELLVEASVIAARQQRERLAAAKSISYQLTPLAEAALAARPRRRSA